MDPTACYLEMLGAMQDRDFDTARERALALRDWLERGGFYPPGYDRAEVRSNLADVLRQTEDIAESEEE